MNHIHEAMAIARVKKGWSQKMLSTRSGIHVNCIQAYEAGRVMPGLLNLIDLADALEISLDEYVGRTVKPE